MNLRLLEYKIKFKYILAITLEILSVFSQNRELSDVFILIFEKDNWYAIKGYSGQGAKTSSIFTEQI